jgi:hypothetical protein
MPSGEPAQTNVDKVAAKPRQGGRLIGRRFLGLHREHPSRCGRTLEKLGSTSLAPPCESAADRREKLKARLP